MASLWSMHLPVPLPPKEIHTLAFRVLPCKPGTILHLNSQLVSVGT